MDGDLKGCWVMVLEHRRSLDLTGAPSTQDRALHQVAIFKVASGGAQGRPFVGAVEVSMDCEAQEADY